jgi:hypothetical protein
MHLSDTLVLGPLPLRKQPVRLPLRSALAGLFGLLLAGGLTMLLTFKPLPAPVAALTTHVPGLAPAPVPAAPDLPLRLDSVPAGATILVDGRMVGTTPATVAVPIGHPLVLQRTGAPAVTVIDAGADLALPVWPAPTVLAVRAPVPGGVITDVQLLADGRLDLAVASPAAPSERQAWLLDPMLAHLERVGPATRDDPPPAGVVVAPDGQHRVTLVRGAAAKPGAPATADTLVLDGTEGSQSLLPDGLLARGEQVRDLTWAPDSRSALLVTQRPMAGSTRFRVRNLLSGSAPRDLVDLPTAPLEGSWVWAPDGHAVAFLTHTTPPVLASLDLADGELRSVADVPATLLPGAGALAPATWTVDGTLLFAAPDAEDPPLLTATPPLPGGAARPVLHPRLHALAAGRTDAVALADAPILGTAPALGPNGTLLALGRTADGGLLLHTFDLTGHLVADQPLGVSTAGALAVRWDLAHVQLVLLQAAPAGGIDARVLRLGETRDAQESHP